MDTKTNHLVTTHDLQYDLLTLTDDPLHVIQNIVVDAL